MKPRRSRLHHNLADNMYYCQSADVSVCLTLNLSLWQTLTSIAVSFSRSANSCHGPIIFNVFCKNFFRRQQQRIRPWSCEHDTNNKHYDTHTNIKTPTQTWRHPHKHYHQQNFTNSKIYTGMPYWNETKFLKWTFSISPADSLCNHEVSPSYLKQIYPLIHTWLLPSHTVDRLLG